MIISQIVAVSENEVIGKDNQLLWHYSEDLKYFKKRTSGKILIMGRKTFESLKKPLPQRFHIVISHSSIETEFADVRFVNSLAEALSLAEKMTLTEKWPEEVMIIGGGQIYKESLPFADFIYLTRIPGQYQGDTFYSLKLPTDFGLALSQFSEETPGLRFEIWSRQQTIAEE